MNLNQVKILICDDSKNAALVAESLKNSSIVIKFKEVSNLEEFKLKIIEFKPDLVIYKYGIETIECTDILNFMETSFYEAPVVVILENGDRGTIETCLEAGVFEVINTGEYYKLSYIIKKLFQTSGPNIYRSSNPIENSPESIFEAVFNTMYDGIFIYNPKTFSLIEVNSRTEEMYGYSKEELLQLRIGDLSASDLGYTNEAAKESALMALSGEKVSSEWLARKKSGQNFWVLATLEKISVGGEYYLMGIVKDIDKEKEVELSLNESREQYESLTQNSPDVIMRFDRDLRHIYVNNAVKSSLGIEPELFLNKNHEEMGMFPKEMCEFWEENIQLVFDTKKPNKVEFSIMGLRGLQELEWRLYPEYGQSGILETVLAIARDITENKRKEKIQKVLFEISTSVDTTKDLGELFLRIQDSLNIVIDTKNCYIALYDAEKDVITLPFHKDEKDTFTEFPAGKTTTGYVIRTGKSQLVNLERIAELEKTGEIEPIGAPSLYWLGVPLKIAEDIIGVFVVQSYVETVKYTEEDVQLLEFVSGQIARAIERKKSHDKLRSNEERQRRILESSPDGLVVIDINGAFLDFNSSFTELVGLSNDKQFKKLNFFEYVSPEDVIKVQNLLNETLSSGYSKNIEFRMLRQGGREFFVGASMGLISELDDKEDSFVIVAKNINEQKNYEHNLKLAKIKAEESDRLKTAFLSNMSHEIRTPMNAIIGFAELLSVSNPDENEKLEFIAQINHAADSLMRLIDDIIDISKIEAGELKINEREFDFEPVLKEIHQLFENSILHHEKSDLIIEVDNNEVNPAIRLKTDEFRLRQVITNLLNNAIKFTEKGKISFGIKKKYSSSIEFYVKDTGVGIDHEKQKIIFDRFRQGHENKEHFYGGTGLGLSISRHLVEIMGGEIKVNSTEGAGAEFCFTLPYSDSLQDFKSEDDRSSSVRSNLYGKTLIIAEDDESNFKLLFEILKNTGIKILRAKSGEEVIHLVSEKSDIDMILMDIQMPIMDGYTAARIIKLEHPDIPIIAQTAYAMAGEREISLKEGCDDYISKPIRIEDLMDLLEKYLKN